MAVIKKNMDHIGLVFHVHLLGEYVQKCARYEVYMVKLVTRRTVHR